MSQMLRRSAICALLIAALAAAALAQPRGAKPKPPVRPPAKAGKAALKGPKAALGSLAGPCKVTITRNIKIGPYPENVLDLYVPSSVNGAAIVVIHGGAWHSGDKSAMHIPSLILATHGYVVANVNYRLSPAYKWPAHFRDCQLAVRWLRKNAPQWGISPERIGALGGSAGAHLATMLLVVDGSMAAGAKVKCASDWYGPSDLVTAWNTGTSAVRHLLESFLGVPYPKDPALYQQASPVHWVDGRDGPLHINHGAQDTTVPPSQSQALADACRRNGVTHRLVIVPGLGHGYIRNISDSRVRNLWADVLRFFKTHL